MVRGAGYVVREAVPGRSRVSASGRPPGATANNQQPAPYRLRMSPTISFVSLTVSGGTRPAPTPAKTS